MQMIQAKFKMGYLTDRYAIPSAVAIDISLWLLQYFCSEGALKKFNL